MVSWTVSVLFGVLALVFDGIWSVVAVRYQRNYFNGFWVSFLLYASAGFIATRMGRSGAMTGSVVALIDGTLGAVLANVLGAYGNIPRERWVRIIPMLLISQPLLGLMMGYIAGVVAYFL